MKLTLKNIGSIRDAAIEINGITVIAGEKALERVSLISCSVRLALSSFFLAQLQINVFLCRCLLK